MTSTTLDPPLPADQILEQAREVQFSRVLIVAIAGLFYGIGWLPGKLWLGVVFGALMIRQGWCEAQGRQPRATAAAEQPQPSR